MICLKLDNCVNPHGSKINATHCRIEGKISVEIYWEVLVEDLPNLPKFLKTGRLPYIIRLSERTLSRRNGLKEDMV